MGCHAVAAYRVARGGVERHALPGSCASDDRPVGLHRHLRGAAVTVADPSALVAIRTAFEAVGIGFPVWADGEQISMAFPDFSM